MGKLGFLFPGQGSQAIGMGLGAYEMNSLAKDAFIEADSHRSYDYTRLCFEGPEEELKKTENTQPALYVSSVATMRVLADSGIKPDAVAGHSLGEYTALHCAGVFSYQDGLDLVAVRGRAFADAGSHRQGAMAAIIGLDIDTINSVCKQHSEGDQVVVPANINDPSQTVISGDPKAVESACETLKEKGAKRALMLPVSGAFHSPLVEPAAETMKEALSLLRLEKPACLFVNNVDAKVLSDPDEIKSSLVRQVTGSVRWVEVVQKLISEGVDTFVEVGSGKTLMGLLRRIDRSAKCYTTESAESIEKTIAELKA